MKALVISDRQEIADYVTPLLEKKGFDIIRYKWIIKALDNIEEIQPDVVVLSANEYPRQWKTLAGFVQSGIGGKDAKVYLYEDEPLNDEDKEKAAGLNVQLFDDNFCEAESINNESINDEAVKDESIKVELAYNNPSDGSFVFCEGEWYKSSSYITVSDIIENGEIKYLTLFDGNNSNSFSATIKNVENSCRFYLSECL